MSIILSGRFRPPAGQQILARGLSIVMAVAILCLTAPLLALVALAIRLDSPGPIFFRQRRIGLYGRPFTLIKFRTMHDCAKRSEWEEDNRDAVTRVGRWLRAFRIDEIPFPETRHYVEKVLQAQQDYRKTYPKELGLQ